MKRTLSPWLRRMSLPTRYTSSSAVQPAAAWSCAAILGKKEKQERLAAVEKSEEDDEETQPAGMAESKRVKKRKRPEKPSFLVNSAQTMACPGRLVIQQAQTEQPPRVFAKKSHPPIKL